MKQLSSAHSKNLSNTFWINKLVIAYKRTKTSAPTCNTKMQTNAFCKTSLFNMQRQTKRLCRAIGKEILYSQTQFVNQDNRYVVHNNLHNSGSLIKDFTDELRFSGIPFFRQSHVCFPSANVLPFHDAMVERVHQVLLVRFH